ncbi:MAG: hypothetical protein Roseis2KO_32860 [Roseivirga sp.]
MSVPNELSDKYFFHFTHLENLDSIVQNGLLCTNKKTELGIDHLNVASKSIQARRSSMEVTCDPKGTVHDYVPFYLCSTNPMFLSLVNQKNVDQPFVIFFAISIGYVRNNHVVFSDASANTVSPPNFFNDPKDLDKLDWDAIGNRKWARGNDDDELHRRMAEVLVHQRVPVEDIDYIVVWNEEIRDHVKETFEKHKIKCPPLVYSPLKNTYNFHFLKFFLQGQDRRSLVTGPYFLKLLYEKAIETIKEKRNKADKKKRYAFKDVGDMIEQIDSDFCCVKELEGIFELETTNPEHSENVSDHTISVLQNVLQAKCYESLEEDDKNILRLSAYLHDIGKGPKSKWKDGKQPRYPDHPADAPPMIARILSEDVEEISDYEIKMICLLVTYHDLIGEIIGKGRDIKQLYEIVKTEKEFDMLSCLNLADVKAIKPFWANEYQGAIEGIKTDFMGQLS